MLHSQQQRHVVAAGCSDADCGYELRACVTVYSVLEEETTMGGGDFLRYEIGQN